jgi:hypothetical protein
MKRENDDDPDMGGNMQNDQGMMNKRRRGNSESDEVRLLIPSKVRAALSNKSVIAY